MLQVKDKFQAILIQKQEQYLIQKIITDILSLMF